MSPIFPGLSMTRWRVRQRWDSRAKPRSPRQRSERSSAKDVRPHVSPVSAAVHRVRDPSPQDAAVRQVQLVDEMITGGAAGVLLQLPALGLRDVHDPSAWGLASSPGNTVEPRPQFLVGAEFDQLHQAPVLTVAATAVWLQVPLVAHDSIFDNVKDVELLTRLGE